MHLLFFICCCFLSSYTTAQPVRYVGNPFAGQKPIGPDKNYSLIVSLIHQRPDGETIFMESQKTKTDKNGLFHLMIGKGISLKGNIDSVIWSDGSYFLKIENDTSLASKEIFSTTFLMRASSEYSKDNMEGIANDDSSKGFGTFHIANEKHRRPKKITIDLTTSYINVDYKGGNYPIYRHYEWYDENRDGQGISFMLTYSEKTCHEFFESSQKIGDVKLYEKPFQELWLRKSDENEFVIELTRPVPLTNLSETYAIKGPWKIIYLIEW